MERITFEDWMKRVDQNLEILIGISSSDLPDQCWRDWYDDGMTTKEAVKEALSNEGFR